MDIFKKLPFDLQETIYNNYLEKQRKYHIDRYEKLNKNRIFLPNNFNTLIFELLKHYYLYNLINDIGNYNDNSIKDGELCPFNAKEIIQYSKDLDRYYEEMAEEDYKNNLKEYFKYNVLNLVKEVWYYKNFTMDTNI